MGSEDASAKNMLCIFGCANTTFLEGEWFIIKNQAITTRASCCCPDNSQNLDNCLLLDGLPNLRTFNFTAGALWSKKNIFGPGKYEIRCKLPNIDGVWPAFWLWGVGDCYQEIDVFEFVNDSYSESSSVANKKAYMTYHRTHACNGSPHDGCSTSQIFNSCVDYSTNFHTFSVEFDAYQITWKIDGIVRRVIYGLKNTLGQSVDECNLSEATYLLNKNMPLGTNLMHLIVGAGVKNFGTASNPLSRGTYPAVMEVDYIRSYRRIPTPPNPDCTSLSSGKTISNETISGNSEKHIKNTITTSGTVKIESGANVSTPFFLQG